MTSFVVFHVENALHERVRSFRDLPGDPFLRFCRKATDLGSRYTDFIWEYEDSMLNFYQQAAWMEDWPDILNHESLLPDERAIASTVLDATRECYDLAGYLFIEG